MVFCCKITIGDLIFTAATDIEIVKTWRKFTDTATIQFPKNLQYRQGRMLFSIENIKDLIKTGDRVKIELGYNRVLRTEFEGYVSRVQPKIPAELNCENEMFKLKRENVSVSIEDATVRQILQAAAPGYEIECADEIYGDFSKIDTTPVKIFEELKKKAGLYTFFRGNRIVCGLPYSDPKLTEIIPNFVFGKNIVDNSLEYIAPEDCKLKIYGKSIQDDGSLVTYDRGDEGGNIERVNFNYEITKKDLQKIVDKRYDNAKTKGGYGGDVTSFGWPIVEHGQTIRIVDPGIYERRDSKHYVDEVKLNVSVSGGYKRTSTAGKYA